MIPIANPDLGDAEIEAVSDVIKSGMVADGPKVREFEENFAAYCGASHAVATSNGTTALHAALEALDLGPGARVVTTPFSFVASSNAIRLAGYEPVFADISRQTFNIEPGSVRSILEAQAADAILAVHLYGLPCDMDELVAISEEYDVALVEDCAQAHGATYSGRPVGSIGDVSCFSFYPTKNMTTGEGGMIATNNAGIAEHAESFVNHGRPPSGGYKHIQVGHNFRMTSIAAAIGSSQIKKLPDYVAERQSTAKQFTEKIETSAVRTPVVPDDRSHAFHQYTLLTDEREQLVEHLQDNGVGAKIYYPTCIHEQPAYSHTDATVPTAESVADEVVSIPVHPALSEQDEATISQAVNEF